MGRIITSENTLLPAKNEVENYEYKFYEIKVSFFSFMYNTQILKQYWPNYCNVKT